MQLSLYRALLLTMNMWYLYDSFGIYTMFMSMLYPYLLLVVVPRLFSTSSITLILMTEIR
uniref:Uncharacterized protein n=1 Tax=Picea glauca TaxID=3330 RepID=A0A101M3A5_PICGL|nr:hypothetical protein ABT39_MTgene73 [Picea glauca]QHR90759.1 hypothetical protein Q903MT_gene4785 [Picea sitchensis]